MRRSKPVPTARNTQPIQIFQRYFRKQLTVTGDRQLKKSAKIFNGSKVTADWRGVSSRIA
jgi:hypothetical protein